MKLHETNNVYENILLTLNEIIEHLNDFEIVNNNTTYTKNFNIINTIITKCHRININSIILKANQLSMGLQYDKTYFWNKTCFNTAAEYGNLKCLKYLYKHGCPYDKIDACKVAGEFSHTKCLMYMLKKGFMKIPVKQDSEVDNEEATDETSDTSDKKRIRYGKEVINDISDEK